VFRSREGASLEESDRVKISSTSDGVYTLRLIGLTEADSGQYTVKAINDAGQTSCTATLLVHGLLQLFYKHLLYPVYTIKLARRAGYMLAGRASSLYARSCKQGIKATLKQT